MHCAMYGFSYLYAIEYFLFICIEKPVIIQLESNFMENCEKNKSVQQVVYFHLLFKKYEHTQKPRPFQYENHHLFSFEYKINETV